MGNIKLILLSTLACLFNALANTLWKMQFNEIPLNMSNMRNLIGTVMRVKIISGVLLYVASMLLFFYLLSTYKMSQVIPLLAMVYVFNLISAIIIFKEELSFLSLLGVGIILIGIVIYAQGGKV